MSGDFWLGLVVLGGVGVLTGCAAWAGGRVGALMLARRERALEKREDDRLVMRWAVSPGGARDDFGSGVFEAAGGSLGVREGIYRALYVEQRRVNAELTARLGERGASLSDYRGRVRALVAALRRERMDEERRGS